MTTQCKAIRTLDIALPTEAGALARIYSAFHEAKVNVIASWGYEMEPGKAAAHFYATNFEATRDVLTKMGFKPTTSDAVWVEGKDQVGAYAEILGRLSKENISLSATDAFAINGQFASVLFVPPTDWKRASKTLSL